LSLIEPKVDNEVWRFHVGGSLLNQGLARMQRRAAKSARVSSAASSAGQSTATLLGSVVNFRPFGLAYRVPNDRVPGISAFLPCYNEEGNLQSVVSGIESELERISIRHEIVVVDDGSQDRTGEIAERLAASNPSLKAVHHPVNRGYGAAVISGIRACTQPWILLCDGDGQFVPSDIGKLLHNTSDYDVVVGRRVHRADPLMRRINGKAWTLLMRWVLGIDISDVDCGLKLFRRDLLEGIELQAKGAMISAELMAQLTGRGARICEVDVQHLPRRNGEQSGANVRVILRAFKELFLLYGRLRQKRRAGLRQSANVH
jgi:glycosyltransferase involved in cell wall biosynthesis